jgi:hypothetical protein
MDGEVRPSTSTCPHPIPTTNPDPNIPWPLARGESDLTVKVGIDMVQAGRPAATGVPKMWPILSLLDSNFLDLVIFLFTGLIPDLFLNQIGFTVFVKNS